jgi:surfeit locus 1 family protein
MRRPPLLATLVVLACVALMVGLGVWQLQRLAWKSALIARYGAAAQTIAPLAIHGADLPDAAAYRHVIWDCPATGADQVLAGRNVSGQSGFAHVVPCRHGNGAGATVVPVVIGWSSGITPVTWSGGTLTGVAVPGIKGGFVPPAVGARAIDWHVVADPPLAGLSANAAPDPRTIANNHLSYAVQWFLFAATALVIYGLALRKR